jgi:DNA-binding transcriptional LysR family regulator
MGTIPLDRVELLVAIAESGSFSGAAAKLGMPKSSVSRGIARLEADLGAQLLQRTTRRVALTAAGVSLYERSAPLLRSLHEALGSLPEQEEQPSGRLQITAAHDVGTVFLAETVPRFVRRYPAVRVDVRLTNRRVDLVAEGFDLAIRAFAAHPPDSSMVMRRLTPVEMQLFAAPGYLARRGTPRDPGEARDHDWVLFGATWPTTAFGLKGKASVVGDDFLFIRNALRAGAGIGPLPAFLAHEDLARGDLARVLPRQSGPSGRLALLYPRAQHLPRKLTAFRDFLLDAAAGRPLTLMA